MSGWKGRRFLLLLLLIPLSLLGVRFLERPVKVETTTVNQAEVPICLALHGILAARQPVLLSSRVGGTMLALCVREGDSVYRGQVLARVGDPAWEARRKALEAELMAARDEVDKANENSERHHQAFQEGTITSSQFRQIRLFDRAAELRFLKTERALRRLQTSIAGGTLVAPTAGIVTRCFLSQGDRIAPRLPILSLAEGGSFLARFYLPDTDTVPVGSPAEVLPLDGSGTPVSGCVGGVTPGKGIQSGWVQVRDPSLISEGRLVQLRVQTGTHRALVMPTSAVRPSPEGPIAFRVQHGIVHRVFLHLGTEHEGFVEVDLPPGTVVVTKSSRRLREGDRVQ